MLFFSSEVVFTLFWDLLLTWLLFFLLCPDMQNLRIERDCTFLLQWLYTVGRDVCWWMLLLSLDYKYVCIWNVTGTNNSCLQLSPKEHLTHTQIYNTGHSYKETSWSELTCILKSCVNVLLLSVVQGCLWKHCESSRKQTTQPNDRVFPLVHSYAPAKCVVDQITYADI